MKLTKNIITEEKAKTVSPEYVAFIKGDWKAFDVVLEAFEKLKRGQKVLTHSNGQFVEAKVTSINHNDYRAIDGPIVRVGNEEYTWRVDGDNYAVPLN